MVCKVIQSSHNIYKVTVLEGYKLNNHNCTFVSPIYTFPWRENAVVYTPDQGTNREKYFNHIIYQRKDADSGGK